MTRDELIEAIRLHISPLTQCPKYRHPCSVDEKETCRCYAKDVETAKRIVASIEAQGLVAVPLWATPEMVTVGKEARWRSPIRDADNVRDIYNEMIKVGRV